MNWQELSYRLTSVAPMIMHNGQTADPLNKYAKMLKQVSSKRSKTESDYEEMARIEFVAGLYMNGNGPMIPQSNVEAMLINAAKKSKEGVLAKSAVFCTESSDLEYNGPRSEVELWQTEGHRFSALVRVGTARVARMRPIFPEWAATVNLQVDLDQVNAARIDDWMKTAGQIIGLGDWRPQYGRFTAKRIA